MCSDLVTVVVPTLNSERFLKETLTSILNQSHSRLEVIVVDNGSEDQTLQIIADQGDDRIALVQCAEKGPGPARNIGLSAASGDYIAFCDSDDLWAPEKIEVQLQEMRRQSCKVVASNARVIDQFGRYIKSRRFPSTINRKNLFVRNYIINSSAIIRRDSVVRINQNIFHEDYDFWLSNIKCTDSVFICQEELVDYRVHAQGISANKVRGFLAWVSIVRAHGLTWPRLATNLILQFFSRLRS